MAGHCRRACHSYLLGRSKLCIAAIALLHLSLSTSRWGRRRGSLLALVPAPWLQPNCDIEPWRQPLRAAQCASAECCARASSLHASPRQVHRVGGPKICEATYLPRLCESSRQKPKQLFGSLTGHAPHESVLVIYACNGCEARYTVCTKLHHFEEPNDDYSHPSAR